MAGTWEGACPFLDLHMARESVRDHKFQCAAEDRLGGVRSWLMDKGFGTSFPKRERGPGWREVELPSVERGGEEEACRAGWEPGQRSVSLGQPAVGSLLWGASSAQGTDPSPPGRSWGQRRVLTRTEGLRALSSIQDVGKRLHGFRSSICRTEGQ